MKITSNKLAKEAATASPGAISTLESSGLPYSARKDFEDRLVKFKSIVGIAPASEREGAFPEVKGAGKYQTRASDSISIAPDLKSKINALEKFNIEGFVGTIDQLKAIISNKGAPIEASIEKVDSKTKQEDANLFPVDANLLSGALNNEITNFYYKHRDTFDKMIKTRKNNSINSSSLPKEGAVAVESAKDNVLVSLSKKEAYDQLISRLRGLSYPQYIAQLKQIANNSDLLDVFSTGFGENAGISITKDEIELPVSKLLPTQNEINLNKALYNAIKGKEPLSTYFTNKPVKITGPIITFNETFIIDGHHRWAQIATMNPSATVACIDFKSKILTPIQFLKIIQSALLVNAEELKDADDLKGVDIYKSSKKRIEEYIEKETQDSVLGALSKQLKLTNFDQALNYLFTNVLAIKYNNIPAISSPNREKMPQVLDDPDVLDTLLEAPGISTAKESSLASVFARQFELEEAVESNEFKPVKSNNIDLAKVSFLDVDSFEHFTQNLYPEGKLKVQNSQSSNNGKSFILNIDVGNNGFEQSHTLKLTAKEDIISAVDIADPNIRVNLLATVDNNKLIFKEKVK